MSEISYLVYEDGDMLAGFPSLCVAETFTENWRCDSVRMDLVDAYSGEVIKTWVDGVWENGN